MIDVHCHLEQKDYQKDRERVIKESQKRLKSIISCCSSLDDFDLTLKLVEKYKNFVFATFAIHPLQVKRISEQEIENFFRKIKKYQQKIVGIGETGLDYTIEKESFRKKQKELFLKFIQLAKELEKPLIIHSRKAFSEAIEILEKAKAKKVLMHFFTEKKLLEKIIKNKWSISVNLALLKSKTIKKIIRDLPLTQIMTETDSPWLGPQGKRNTPLSVKVVVEKIAEIKKINFKEVDKVTTENAISFFNLPI